MAVLSHFAGSQARPALLRASEGRGMGGGPVEFNCESPPAFRSAPPCSGADSVAVFSHFSGSQARPALLRASDGRRMGGGPVEFNCESPPAFRSAPPCSGADSVAVFSHFSGSQARPALLRASDGRRMGGGPVEFNFESPPAFRSAPPCSGAASVAVFSHFASSQALLPLLEASARKRNPLRQGSVGREADVRSSLLITATLERLSNQRFRK